MSSYLVGRRRGDRLIIVTGDGTIMLPLGVFFGSFALVPSLDLRCHVASLRSSDGNWRGRIVEFVIPRRVTVEKLKVRSLRRPGIFVKVIGTRVRVEFTVTWRRIIGWRVGASKSFVAVLHGEIGVNFEITSLSLLGDIAGCQCSVVEWSHIVVVVVSYFKRLRWR